MKVLGFLVALAAVAFVAASEDDEHDHPFELAAAFDIEEAGVYTWLIVKEAGEHDEHGHERRLSGEDEEEPTYAFDHNRLSTILVPGACTSDSIEDFEEEGEELLNVTVVVPEVESGEVISLNHSTVVTGQELHVNEDTFTSLWLFDIAQPGCLIMYSEHVQDDGFFSNDHGEEVEPSFLEVEEGEPFSGYSSEVWLVTLGAVLLVSLTAFLGAALLLCGFERTTAAIAKNIDDILTFATGVILGLCFFHLLPEAVEFNGGFDWEMSLALAVTFFISLGVKMTCGSTHDHSAEQSVLDSKEVEAGALASEEGFTFKKHATSLNLLWGDFFCNFADGVVIAASFAICADSTLGWLLTGAIILHEAPQEISDILVIYEDFGSIKIALCINVLSACGAFAGAILVLGLGTLSGQALGLLLAAGAMALIFVCLVEIVPRVVLYPSKERAFLRLFLIIIGFVIMGLTILAESGHCELGGEEGHGDEGGHGGH